MKYAAAGSPEEKTIWNDLLRSRYAKVFDVDLSSATPNQLAEAIAAYGNPTGIIKKRAIRFFLKTAQYAGVVASARLVKDLPDCGTDSPGTQATPQEPTNGGGSKPKKKRRTAPPLENKPADTPVGTGGLAMKTIALAVAGGTLTLNGTFNPFALVGYERELVYSIIDKMCDYESKAKPDSED